MNRIFIYSIFIVVIFLSSCSARKEYEQAKQSQSVNQYREFLENHPSGKYSDLAQDDLETLTEEEDWMYAMKYDNIKTFEKFISDYPNSNHKEEAILKLIKLEKSNWEQALKHNTMDLYKSFILDFPSSKYVEDAKGKINELNSEIAWKNTLEINKISTFQSFISFYPKSKHIDEANNILEDKFDWIKAGERNTIESYELYLLNHQKGEYFTECMSKLNGLKALKPIWDKVKRRNTYEAFREFIFDYPNSSYSDIARREMTSIEYLDWSSATRSKSVRKYKDYIKKYPYGKHRNEAEKGIIDAEVDNIFKGDYGKLPPLSKSNYGNNYSSTSSVKIYNKTKYTLTLRYSGTNESKKVVFNPHQTKTVTLKNGNYRTAASVSASGVDNYAGKENLDGSSYDVEYYIVTSYGR